MTPDEVTSRLEAEIYKALELILGPRGRDQVKGITPVVNELAMFNYHQGRLEGYELGQQSGLSRARSRPGDGDMGG